MDGKKIFNIIKIILAGTGLLAICGLCYYSVPGVGSIVPMLLNPAGGETVSEEQLQTAEALNTLQAVAQQATVDTAIRLTADVMATDNGGGSADEVASSTATMTATLASPSDSNSGETTTGDAYISVDTNTYCRSGPGAIYGLLGTLLVGQSAKMTGWDGNGSYYYIVNPDNNRSCWLWAEYATVTGDTSTLPVFTPPPTPTNTPTPTFTFTPTLTSTSTVTPTPTP